MQMCLLWKVRKVSSSAEEWGQDSNECKMYLCCLMCLCVRYLQLEESTDSSIIIFFIKFSKESKILSNGNISAAVRLIHYRGHGYMLSRETLQRPTVSFSHSCWFIFMSEMLYHFLNIASISLCHVRFLSGLHRLDQI